MKPISPVVPEKEYDEIIMGANQSEYENCPVINCGDGVLLSRWGLSEDEKKQILEKGYIYFYQWTFNHPMQPVLLTLEEPQT